MNEDRLLAVAEDLLRGLAAATKSVHLYAADHPIVGRAIIRLGDVIERLLAERDDIVLGVVNGQVVVGGLVIYGTAGISDLTDRLASVGVERIVFRRGITRAELSDFVRRLPAAVSRQDAAGDHPSIDGTDHIVVTRLLAPKKVDAAPFAMRVVRQAYTDAVQRVEDLWTQAVAEGQPDPLLAADIIESLAELVGRNRRAVVALTAQYQYDNYTFTHMVNVGLLTMAQARSLGIEGPLLHQVGLAGLMHDIGKIRTPIEILNKPSKLTDAELVIMRRHPTDGADILRRQLEMPPLVAVVAFEHHLKLDGTGYPARVQRQSLNLATQLCTIADIYDAMRSNRPYQRAHPTDRILTVLNHHDPTRHDASLIRRFTQLMGLYPPGSLLQMGDGALAVVVATHAPVPGRPAIRVVRAPDGSPISRPAIVALWEQPADDASPECRIVTPVDPVDAGIDPFEYLDDAAA